MIAKGRALQIGCNVLVNSQSSFNKVQICRIDEYPNFRIPMNNNWRRKVKNKGNWRSTILNHQNQYSNINSSQR